MDSFCIDGIKTSEHMYGELAKTCAKWDVTADVLVSQCVSILYEGHAFLDDAVYLVKQRLSGGITRVPFLSHCAGRVLVQLVMKNAASFKLQKVMNTVKKSNTFFATTLWHKLHRLQAVTGLDADAWIHHIMNDIGIFLGNMHLLPTAFRELVPILVDWAEILLPVSHMIQKILARFETSQDHIFWLEARRQFLMTLRGDRVVLRLAREKLRVTGAGVGNMAEIIAEIIEVMDLRFIVTDEHKDAFARLGC